LYIVVTSVFLETLDIVRETVV